jgi:hypothetical protein
VPFTSNIPLNPRFRWELRSSDSYTASSCNILPTLRDNLSVTPSRVKNPKW